MWIDPSGYQGHSNAKNATNEQIDEINSALDNLRGMEDCKSTAVTVAYDKKTGNIYEGASGMNPNKNPTIKNDTDKWLQDQRDELEKALREGNLLSNNGNGSYELWDIENCGEFNAINNALAGGADINDLTIKTVNRKSGDVMAPCDNCQAMYGEFVEFLFN